jgi:hypothetical protein
MSETKKMYLKILRIEIEDLKTDIEHLIEELKKEHENEHLTNYVFLENLTIFGRELLGVGYFFKVLDKINPDEFDTLDSMADYIKETFRNMVKEHGLDEAINIYVERKLDKVKKYVTGN